MKTKRILLINGPNLQLLGCREKDIYGSATLADIVAELTAVAAANGAELTAFQSNHEGDIVDTIGNARGQFDGIVINPAAYSHTSIAILDALRAAEIPAVEVHLSNIHKREDYRHVSVTAPGCVGVIAGLGKSGYRYALLSLLGK